MRKTLVFSFCLSVAAPLWAGEGAPSTPTTKCYIVGDLLPSDLPLGDVPAAYRQLDEHMKPIESEIEARSKEIDDLYDQEAEAARRGNDAESRRLTIEIEDKERALQAKREESFIALRNGVSTAFNPVEALVLKPALAFALRNGCKSLQLVRSTDTRDVVKEGAWDLTEAFAASYGLAINSGPPSDF